MIFRTNKLEHLVLGMLYQRYDLMKLYVLLILFAQIKLEIEKNDEKLNYKLQIQITDICNNT